MSTFLEDLETVVYFIETKGCPSNWVSWDEKGKSIASAIPELDDWLRAKRVAESLKEVALEKMQLEIARLVNFERGNNDL